MEKNEKYTDVAVEMTVDAITSGSPYGRFGFNQRIADINNVLNLFDEDQLMKSKDDGSVYCCALLEDGRLFSFSYYYTSSLCHVGFDLIENINKCTIQIVNGQNHPNTKFIKIVDEDGYDVIRPMVAPENVDENSPLNKIMRPVSMGQLYVRGILGCNGDDYDDGVIYDLVMLLNGKLNSEIVEHDENMEQSGLFKIFDENQMILTETESGVETCLVRLADKILRIVCMPPVSNNGKNQYYMAFYSDPEKYMVKPTILENERISIEITRSDVENTSNDEEKAFLEIPEMILKETKLTEILKPISYEQLLERIKNILHKTK